MKKYISFVLLLFALMQVSTGFAQKKTLAILNIDTRGFSTSSSSMGNLIRLEVNKLDIYEVMDKYDIAFLTKNDSTINVENCYGKLCLLEIAEKIKVDKMLTGSIQNYEDKVVVMFRLIDVASKSIEKTQVSEFADLPREVEKMAMITLREMFGLENEVTLLERLTQKNDYENLINNSGSTRLNLTGPRMGFAAFTGDIANYLEASTRQGGFDAYPVFFQFGYQFETQYLNEGNWQALFEFIPSITGVDQGYFMPSFTILNGLRNNKNGWEIALGPTLRFTNQAEGYYDAEGNWLRRTDSTPAEQETTFRLDSRGDLKLRSGVVIAFGKSFRSGKLNIPMNAYLIPHKEGLQFGVSFGFNAKK